MNNKPRTIWVLLYGTITLLALSWQSNPKKPGSFEQGPGPFEQGEAAYKAGNGSIALAILQPLARDGNADAQYYVGSMYDSNDYRSRALSPAHSDAAIPDLAEAAKWYQLAAEQGHFLAQANLGRMYFCGQGVPGDLVHSHMWLSLATMSPTVFDAAIVVRPGKLRDFVASQMTHQQIVEAQSLAEEWLATHHQPPR